MDGQLPTPSDIPECALGDIPTIDGRLCWLTVSVSAGKFGGSVGINDSVYFGADGLYHVLQDSKSLYWPPSFGTVAIMNSFGCADTGRESVDAEYIDSLGAIAFTFSLWGLATGYTLVLEPEARRAVQLDAGVSFSAGSFLPWFPLGISVGQGTNILWGPVSTAGCENSPSSVMRMPYPDGFEVPMRTLSGGGDGSGVSPLKLLADGLRPASERTPSTYQGALETEVSRALVPMLDFLGDTSGTRPEDGRPVATNGDLYADWFERDNRTFCTDCPDTSLDFMSNEYFENLSAAGDDESKIAAASGVTRDRQLQITPELVRQGFAIRKGAVAAGISNLLAEEIVAKAQGDAHRYIADDIVELEVATGEAIEIYVTAEEIADLVGAAPEAIAGAQVTIGAEPRVDSGTFEMNDGLVGAGFTAENSDPYLVQIEVDLSTAAGPFAEADVSDWVVRPSLRMVRPTPGAAALSFMTAPPSASLNVPVTLNGMVLDESYSPVQASTEVMFVDGEGNVLGRANTVDGTAAFAKALSPSSPKVSGVEPATLVFGDDSEGPGYNIFGTGFSRDAAVYVDGRQLADDVRWAVGSSRSILIAKDDLELTGSHTVTVENPRGIRSMEQSFSVE